MPRVFGLVILIVLTAPPAVADSPLVGPAAPLGAAEGLLPYRYEKAGLRPADVITLNDGTSRCGKFLEWATQFLQYDGDGTVSVIDSARVMELEFRRLLRHKIKPDLPDLTVAYIERLPRDPSFHGHVVIQDGIARLDFDPAKTAWHPKPGSEVSFRVHVLNAGKKASNKVVCRVLMDGAEIKKADLPPIAAEQEQVVEVPWAWKDGDHSIRVEIDPDGKQSEVVRWNNIFEEPVQAQAVDVVVASDRYDGFKSSANLVDSFCFEDWVQYQLRALNALFIASVHPSAPHGILERVRCDRIVVVNDPDDAEERPQWEPALRSGGKPDGLAEYAAILAYGRLRDDEVSVYAALKLDWRRLQDVCKQLGLMDLRATDTRPEQCLAVDHYGRYAPRQHLFPWPKTFMYEAGNYPLDEVSAGYLNQTRGRPRGISGEYLYQLPPKAALQVVSGSGNPLEGVQVDVYQLQSEGESIHTIAGVGRGDPLYSAPTGPDGRLALLAQETPAATTPNGYELRPNPFGKIALDGSNGLLLLHLKQGSADEFHFLRLFDFNRAWLRGAHDEFVHRIATHFGDKDAPNSPLTVPLLLNDRTASKPTLTVTWKLAGDARRQSIDEFRLYKRTGLAGDDEVPWTLFGTVRRTRSGWSIAYPATFFDEIARAGRYSLDTFFAVSAVDDAGRESNLSPPSLLAWHKDSIKLAIDGDAAYITLAGDGPVQMIRWQGDDGEPPGPHLFAVGTAGLKGYQPHFAGVAFTPDHRLLVTDPVNHVLVTYDPKGDMLEVSPRRELWPGYPSDEPGEFNQPMDVAVDAGGHVYVADYGNSRVQILDAQGAFKGMLDPEAGLKGPHSLGVANGFLCVTDRAGSRCRVYDVRGPVPKFVRELPPLVLADRGLVSKTGRVYITGSTSIHTDPGVLIFDPDGTTARLQSAMPDAEMGKLFKPRGMYFFINAVGEDYAYFVNQFHFDVRRIKME